MDRFSLDSAWEISFSEHSDNNCTGMVPGSVYSALIDAGKMDDPFWRSNEMSALAIAAQDVEFSKTFEFNAALQNSRCIRLLCEGLDTLAVITLNGREAGRADNMHRIWEFDVRSLLVPGENHISIRFASPTRYIREAYAQSRADGTTDAMTGFPLLRKAHCMFGWDWGPRLPDMGIWRGISLVAFDTARISGVQVTQTHETGCVTLRVVSDAEIADPQADVRARVTVIAPDGQALQAEGVDCDIVVDNPRLWWPNGLGDQPLYTVRAELLCGGEVLDVWERRIGLRVMTVRRQKDEWGESFAHEVNGVAFFAMGADYIPEDNILSRVTPERTRRLLSDAAEAHCNVVRVWGGGYYPDDFFYDICDELGLVVWQDFMFACAVYNLTEEFERNIRAEITDNVRRLRHHASLGLWCGNNEMEQFVAEGMWVSSPRQKADYIKMYEYIIPQILQAEDPQTFYWPASPSSGGSFDAPNDDSRGDVHYWAVWHGGLPFTDYRNHCFRYVSEFGFQSFPAMKTIEAFTLPEDRNVFSYVMEKHQRNASANGKILMYLSQMYLYPRDLDTLVYASQLLQAQAMQYGVEHWRRHRGRCMGAVIWQLNDCWPVASWSSIDYFGRWKALHYSMKRFFAPVLISCREEGVLSQNTNVNAEPFALKMSARLNVSNETAEAFHGRAYWALRRPDASVLREGELSADVAPFSAVWLEELDFSGEDEFGVYFSYRLESGGQIAGSGSVLFCPPKHFRFSDPHLSARIDGAEIVVEAHAYARSVELLCDEDTVLEDNYFDMDAGHRRVRILRGSPSSVSARSVYDIR